MGAKLLGIAYVAAAAVAFAFLLLPIVALLVWFGIRRIRKAVARDAE